MIVTLRAISLCICYQKVDGLGLSSQQSRDVGAFQIHQVQQQIKPAERLSFYQLVDAPIFQSLKV